eukprot:g40144.t1
MFLCAKYDSSQRRDFPLFPVDSGFADDLVPCLVKCDLDAKSTAISCALREQIDTSVAILDRLLQALDPVYLAENFKVELQKGLQHSDDNVKILAMSQIGRIVENANAMPLILGSPELLKEMIRSIGGKKISVAKE